MILYNENFKDFPLAEFPYDKDASALGEYHSFKQIGYTGNWYDPISLHQWRGLGGSWLITSGGGKRYLEQNRGDFTYDVFKSVYSVLVLKNKICSDYKISVNLTVLEDLNPCGICINYLSSRNLVMVVIDKENLQIIRRNEDEFITLACHKINSKGLDNYFIEILLEKNQIFVYIDKILQIKKNFERINSLVGVIAKSACRYSDFIVSLSEENYLLHKLAILSEEKRLENIRKKYPPLELIKKINLSNFGTGRQLRVIPRKGKSPYFIMCQHQKRLYRDSFARISCITAFDLEGNIVWQIGEAIKNFDNALISADLPIQVADINNDGLLEIIYSVDFKIYIIDALSGKLIKSFDTPLMQGDRDISDYPYRNLNVDAIRVADFSGKGYKGDIIIKDRYKKIWVYNYHTLDLLWTYHNKNTGHFPYIFDFNSDGLDEMFVGYDMVDSKGNILWSLPMNSDHTDEIIFINLEKNEPKRLFLASGNEGFNIVNLDGSIYKHNEIGHAQRISIANFDGKDEHMKVIVSAFWGSDGIIRSYDSKLNVINTIEQKSNGNVITPVSYDGIHILSLLNASNDGGLIDANLDKVVLFPNDGHPFLSSEVYDIDNDGIDEILCWDLDSMWIYKASKYEKGKLLTKYPDDSWSNYRGEYLIIDDIK